MDGVHPVKLFDMYDGFAPISNLLGMADPDVHKIGDRWCMFFGGLADTLTNNVFSASLPPGAPLSSSEWSITSEASEPHRAVSLVAQPDEGSWDQYGLHAPSYVRGIDPHAAGGPTERERVYYAGRGSEVVLGDHGPYTTSPYSIGVLENTPSGWVRYPAPILTGTADSASVLEPKARYFEGKWRIWYVTTPHDSRHGEPAQYQIQYVESDDGITNWSTPQTLFPTTEGYFDAAVLAVTHGYEMVASRHRTTPPSPNDPAQGLWWMTGQTPSGDRDAWSHPIRILDADHGQPWHASGAHGPSIHYGDTDNDRHTLYVFFNGIYHPPEPPFPAPFFCAIGRLQLPAHQLHQRTADAHTIPGGPGRNPV